MASSMCGPSNALSSLKNHTTADRSLQQDRVHTPASSSSSQPFRTQLQTRVHDSEFDQFAANSGLPPQLQHAPPPLQQQHAPAWAADFQRLHIGAPPPLVLQQQQQPQQQWGAGAWHEEFMMQQHQMAAPGIEQQAQYIRAPGMGMMGMGGMYSPMTPVFMGGMVSPGLVQQNSAQQTDVQAQFDDAAFEQAFEAARAQLAEEEKPVVEEVEKKVVEVEPVVEEVNKEQEVKDNEHDSDELAKTAAQLLESLSGNQSRKFQDSTFLALMRRLRDREVRVEGDKMVEVEVGPDGR